LLHWTQASDHMIGGAEVPTFHVSDASHGPVHVVALKWRFALPLSGSTVCQNRLRIA
jgi:hypothetical protein